MESSERAARQPRTQREGDSRRTLHIAQHGRFHFANRHDSRETRHPNDEGDPGVHEEIHKSVIGSYDAEFNRIAQKVIARLKVIVVRCIWWEVVDGLYPHAKLSGKTNRQRSAEKLGIEERIV